jgi:plastocyanin
MNRITRRTLLGGALMVPVAGITLRGVTATRQDSTPTASPEASPMASPDASPVAGNEVLVEARDIEYSVTEIAGPADADFTIKLVNMGVLEHDLVIDALELATPLLKPGEEGEIVVNAPAGEYEYYCTVAGHKELGMVGTLTLA